MHSSVAVHDVMVRDFVGVSESDALGPAASLLLSEDADAVVVLRGTDPVGKMSAQDALSALLAGADPESTTVGEVMSDPAPSVGVETDLATARGRLMSEPATHLLVVDGDDLVGVLTERDVLTASGTRPTDDDPYDRDEAAMEDAVYDRDTGPDVENNGEATYAAQSVCEICGSLTHELSNVDGQLVCADCRDI